VSDAPVKKTGGFADLGPRVLSAVAMIASALGALYAGGDLFVLFWLSAGVAVNWEWQRLIGGERLEVRYGAGGATVAAAAALGHLSLPLYAFLVILAGAIGVAALADAPRRLWAGAGVLYASALVFSVCVLRTSEPYGLAAIAMLFAIVWGTDIFAYFGGRLIGGPKLWPAVSAGKTWSGTLTGVFSGAALGLAAARMGAGEGLALAPTFLICLVVAAVSQAGDLFESSIKRRYGVKDSSQLIPGHGGVMDRLDGFTFAVIFAASLGLVRAGASVAAGLFFW
jgi:phosphatidate cytidylyltransferase